MKTIRALKKNSWICDTRQRLGLSQEQMAVHLQMSRSAYSMLELGRRQVPTAVLLLISQLEIRLANKHPANKAEEPKEMVSPINEENYRRFSSIFNRGSVYRKWAERLRTRLERMRSNYTKSCEWLNVVESSLAESEHDLRMKTYWIKQQRIAVTRQRHCSLTVQRLLEVRVELLDALANLYVNMKERLSREMPEVFEGGREGH